MVAKTLGITNLPVLRNALVASIVKAFWKSPELLSLTTLIEFVNPSRTKKIETKNCPSPTRRRIGYWKSLIGPFLPLAGHSMYSAKQGVSWLSTMNTEAIPRTPWVRLISSGRTCWSESYLKTRERTFRSVDHLRVVRHYLVLLSISYNLLCALIEE